VRVAEDERAVNQMGAIFEHIKLHPAKFQRDGCSEITRRYNVNGNVVFLLTTTALQD
jgi:hypothetical protein